jgi:hypothetical protein
MNSPERQELEEQALLGDDVEKLLGGKVGNYLVQRCKADIDDCLRQLRTINPTDTIAIITLQMRLEQRETFLVWLADAVTDGDSALQILAQLESED